MRIGPVGTTELLVILGIVLLLLGSRRLPALASALGSTIRQFQRGLRGKD